jgi:hypothetical protein
MADPTPMLVALTPEAREAMHSEQVKITHFPFRVGRESRMGMVGGALQVMERRKLNAPPNNDLYLIDDGKPLNVSREHFQIERTDDGRYELVDRGSACGTMVGNEILGGHDQGGRCTLENGNVIVVGTSRSPFAFKFVIPGDDA